MQLIIVSGLIGSGKTTVSKLLKKKKFQYLNADGMAKDLLKTNEWYLNSFNNTNMTDFTLKQIYEYI